MGDHVSDTRNPMFNNRTYDTIKAIAQYWIPAISGLYATLVTLWHLPYGFEVVGTMAAIDVALGVLLGVSTKSYIESGAKYDGQFLVDDTGDERDVFTLNVDKPFDELKNQKDLTLEVRKE